jgi:transcriptional regulator with GAF, ATPase, and Fis domain
VALAAGGPEDLSGKSPEIGQVRSALRQVADSDLTVLMLGETGTGKSVAAKLLHANCGAITKSLVEAELFGHENGALA